MQTATWGDEKGSSSCRAVGGSMDLKRVGLGSQNWIWGPCGCHPDSESHYHMALALWAHSSLCCSTHSPSSGPGRCQQFWADPYPTGRPEAGQAARAGLSQHRAQPSSVVTGSLIQRHGPRRLRQVVLRKRVHSGAQMPPDRTPASSMVSFNW